MVILLKSHNVMWHAIGDNVYIFLTAEKIICFTSFQSPEPASLFCTLEKKNGHFFFQRAKKNKAGRGDRE